ncbi:hypothetical protein pb186bvf_008566 [Paramecium bursaria]
MSFQQSISIQSPRSNADPTEFYPPVDTGRDRKIQSFITNIQLIVALFQIQMILFNAYVAFQLTFKICILYITVIQFLHIIKVCVYNKRLTGQYQNWARVFWGSAMISFYVINFEL